jgi:hypothetical protein
MFATLDLSVGHLPDRAGIAILVVDEWLLALNPSEEARLVRPLINRVSQNGRLLNQTIC